MSKITVILGAGASVEYGVPLTGALTDQIEARVLNDGWLKSNNADETYNFIRGTLRKYLVKPGGEHFEQIYHVIEELCQLSQQVDASAYDEFRYLLKPFVEIINSPVLANKKLSILREKYIHYLFEIISESCQAPKYPIAPLTNFLTYLSSNYITRIYSLNYDDYVLQAKPDLFNGFDKINNGKFLRNQFSSNRDTSSVFQLHGSVRMGFPDLSANKNFEIGELGWFDNFNTAIQYCDCNSSGDRQMDGGDIKPSAVITGLDKLSRIQSAPFNYYYSSLAPDLLESEFVIIAGYGMGDIHVNKWLKEARLATPGMKAIIVDMVPPDFFTSLDRKNIELVQMIRLDVTSALKFKRGPSDGWVLLPDSKAAIWTKGFQSFLFDGNLNEVLRKI